MKKYISMVLVAVALLVTSLASAQTVAVDITKARLSWTWVPGTGSGALVDYEVRCGQASKVYTKNTAVALNQNSIPVSAAITGNGPWFCTVAVRNQWGTLVGNEVSFAAGAGPIGAVSVSILAQ